MPQEILKILVTGDLHAQLDQDPAAGRPGLARIVSFMAKERASGVPTLAIDLGDLVSGSPYAAFDQGRTVASLAGRLNYRALLPGNHDFDYSPETLDPLHYFNELLPRLASVNSKPAVLALNLTYKGQPIMESGRPLILSKDPLVAAVGIMTPLTHRPSLGPILNDFDFGLKTTLKETKAALLSRLKEIAAPIAASGGQVVAFSHLGASTRAYAGLKAQMSLDLENAPTGPDLAMIPGVSLVVDGHSHKAIWPKKIEGGGIYVNLGVGGRGILKIAIFKDARLAAEFVPAETLFAYPPEPKTASLIEDLRNSLGLGEKLLDLPKDLAFGREEIWDSIVPLGQMAVRAMAKAANCQLAFLNKGSVRAGLAGEITVGSLAAVLPFNDSLIRLSLKGAALLDLFRGFGQKGFRGFPLYHGLTLWTYPEGEEIKLAKATDFAGEPIFPEKDYTLALSGQAYRLLSSWPLSSPEAAGSVLDAVKGFIRENGLGAFWLDPKNPPYLVFPDKPSALLAYEKRGEGLGRAGKP